MITRKIIAMAIFCAAFSLSYAAEENSNAPTKAEETFQSTCVNAWLGRFPDVKDKTDYKNFGEEYCTCASTQPLEGSEAIDKAAKTCMTRTLLTDAMNKLEEDGAMDDATASSIDEYCMARWNLAYPQMDDKLKQVSSTYCGCAKDKLLSLIKDSTDMTDKQYYDHINEIAANCSAQL